MRNIFIWHSKALDGKADGPYRSNTPAPSPCTGFLSTHHLPPRLFPGSGDFQVAQGDLWASHLCTQQWLPRSSLVATLFAHWQRQRKDCRVKNQSHITRGEAGRGGGRSTTPSQSNWGSESLFPYRAHRQGHPQQASCLLSHTIIPPLQTWWIRWYSIFFFIWRIIALQSCIGLWHTRCISCNYIYSYHYRVPSWAPSSFPLAVYFTHGSE